MQLLKFCLKKVGKRLKNRNPHNKLSNATTKADKEGQGPSEDDKEAVQDEARWKSVDSESSQSCQCQCRNCKDFSTFYN